MNLKKLAIQLRHKGFIPEPVRKFLQQHMDVLDIRTKSWIAKDPFAEDPPYSTYTSEYPYVFGIIKEFWHMHWPFIAACRDLKVSYKVLDISGPDWINIIENSGCDAFLAQPSVQLNLWKQMYDERLYLIEHQLKKVLFPSFEELWIWESKRRMHYWMVLNNIPHPKTWVFYSLKTALEFTEKVELPVVFKSDMGSGATGVIIFRDRSKLKRHTRRCFKKGFTTYRRVPNDKEWGFILFQEYIKNAREWRMIRIGNSYFGYEKLKVGDFHSGSHQWRYGLPPSEILDFLKMVTDRGNFLSMDLDVLISEDGDLLVNELQTLFGMGNPYEMCVVENQPGRMIYEKEKGEWQFEAGSFCQNYLCNERVITLLELVGAKEISNWAPILSRDTQ